MGVAVLVLFVLVLVFVVLVLASGLGLWSAFAMSTRGGGTPLPAAMPNRLVIAGPYRFVRNPMALAGIVQGAAVGLIASSWLVVLYALLGSLVWNHVARPHEEADLERRFGPEFTAYRDAVRCCEVLLHLGREGQSASADDLGVYGLLLGAAGGDDVARFVRRTVGPVLDYDRER